VLEVPEGRKRRGRYKKRREKRKDGGTEPRPPALLERGSKSVDKRTSKFFIERRKRHLS